MEDRRSRFALDALSFFIADAQTGFGPFIAVYLATSGWSEGEIGRALSVGSLAAILSQLPGGALVDRLADKRRAAAGASLAVGAAALLFALSSSGAAVIGAEVLHSFGSAMLGPAIAAVSLAVVGRGGLGLRLGRNARFAAIGNGAAAALLGAAGAWLSPRAVFWLTAAFVLPGLAALRAIGPPRRGGGDAAVAADLAGVAPSGASAGVAPSGAWQDLLALLRRWPVLGFTACVALFHLGNAALLPLASAGLAQSLGSATNLAVAGAVVVPQAIVALISPGVGRAADRHGPRLVLAIGFAAVPLRALLLGLVSSPVPFIAVQALDGLSAAAFGTLVPLVAADLTRGRNGFNLCLGLFGVATGVGAALSTAIGGTLAERYGSGAAFLTLAGFGVGAVLAACGAAPGRRERP